MGMSEAENEVSVRELRANLAEVLHAATVYGRVTYITSHGRRVAAIVPIAVAEGRSMNDEIIARCSSRS